jgi:hypothetical protein
MPFFLYIDGLQIIYNNYLEVFMKKLLFLSALFLIVSFSFSFAIVRTVSNVSGAKAMYTDIQSAVNASTTGDVILVHPSPSIYSDFTINKTLTIKGFGYNSDYTTNYLAKVNYINIQTNSINSTIEGFYIVNGITYINNWTNTNNITIRNCNVGYIQTGAGGSNYSGNNWNIYNNIIRDYIDLYSGSGHTIQNNIFTVPNTCIRNANFNSIVIRNNVFTGCTNCNAFLNVTYATINNNIFYGKSPQSASFSGFNNNITYNTNNNNLPYGDNTPSQNNIVNQNPLFVSAPARDNFNYSYDYHLQPGSPGEDAGTDGTDIGIYGGAYPWPDHLDGTPDYSGQPYIPFIKSFNLINNVVKKNGYLKFNAQAVKKD